MIQLTEEQEQVINEVLKFNKQVVCIGGYAGTGKSTIVSVLKEELPDFGVCAFTGKAANVLRNKGIDDASTIHSLIYKMLLDSYGNPILDKFGNPQFILNPEITAKGFIVDEASMVNKEIDSDLRSFGLPIIYVGDHGQLEQIGEAANLMVNPDYKLEKIHRHAGEIAHFADFIRNGYNPISFAYHHSPEDIKFIRQNKIIDYLTDVDQILCAFNKTRVEINKKTRAMLGFDPNQPVVGDKIICLRNDKTHGLFNGMQGYIQKINKNKIQFKTEDMMIEVFVDKSQFNKEKYDFGLNRDDPAPFDYAYCITTHKAQGSEFDSVMVIEQRCNHWDHKRWAYTAASRAKKNIIWAS